ncbi:MAG TPA: nucleotidyltransferase family protein [Bacilli bacterium]|nr:nucleotidyltransferase family protein [Bacilli bacterium]
MKILGIIVEFNPLHHGHLHFMSEAKRLVNPDVVIAVVSNHVSMRGDIMVMDKLTKTKLMLDIGIDLVLELPVLSATQNADWFSYHAVTILNEFGVTDIVFGSETGDLFVIEDTLKVSETTEFQERVKHYLDQGFGYPASHSEALKEFTTQDNLQDAFRLPNQILGLQYVKSIQRINPNIQIHTIPRIISSYHELTPHHDSITSATAIRQMMIDKQNYKPYIGFGEESYPMIDLELAIKRYFLLIQYELSKRSDFSSILGMKEGIENRLIKYANVAKSYEEFLQLCTTKRYTTSRIKRVLLYLLLGISSEFEHKPNYHLRVLGMTQNGTQHLNQLPKETKMMLITNIGEVDSPILNVELQAAKLYGILINQPEFVKTEYLYPIKKKEGISYDSKGN